MDPNLRAEHAVSAGYRVVWPDGSIHYVCARGGLVRDEAGRPQRLEGVLWDISESKLARAKLQESEERYRSLVELSPDTVLVHSEGVIVYVNTAGARTFGASNPEDVIGRTIWDFIHPDYWETVRERVRRVQQCHEPVPAQEIVFRRLNGQEIHADTTSVPILVSGRMASLSIIRDITERRHLQAQFQQAQKMESVGRLAGGVAHDFNNMLGVILGNVELALGQVDPAQPLHADLTEIRDAAVHSAELTGQLLAFARKQVVAPRVLDLNETVEGMLKMLRRLIGEDIDLAWLPGAGLWPIKVDPSQVDQILANLCVNCRDAIPSVGRLAIETRNATIDDAACASSSGATPGDYVVLAVSDTGSGMSRDVLDHIFEPFFTTKEWGEERASGWPPSTASSSRTTASSVSTASRTRGRRSRSICRAK